MKKKNNKYQLTLADYFNSHANAKKFVYEIETKKKKNHKEIRDCSKKISANLDKLLNKSKIVTVILPNSISYIELYLATMLSGGIFNPLPYFTDANELGKILSYIEPDVIITDKLDLIHKFKNKFKLLKPNELLSGKEVYIKKKK